MINYLEMSPELLKGLKWLENFIEEKNEDNIISFIDIYYVLNKINHPLINQFYDIVKDIDPLIYDDFFDDVHDLYYCSKLGLENTSFFKAAYEEFIKDGQTVKGHIHSNTYDHTGPMRVLTLVEPNSNATQMAIDYFIDNFDRFSIPYQVDSIALGVITLFEHDYYTYKDFINKLALILKEIISDSGFIEILKKPKIKTTAFVVQALTCVYGSEDPVVSKSIEWLRSVQQEDGSWGNYRETIQVILALISVGDGPKISFEELRRKEMILKQEIDSMKPQLIATVPFDGNFSIKDKIKEMIYSKTNKLWISSRFITEFWTDIITLKKEKPSLDIRILTIPYSEARSKYQGDGKKFVDIAFEVLQRTLESNMKTSTYLHARFIITDSLLLVSSADLSTEQLEKEFNLGILIKDPDAIKQATEIFEKIWLNTTKA